MKMNEKQNTNRKLKLSTTDHWPIKKMKRKRNRNGFRWLKIHPPKKMENEEEGMTPTRIRTSRRRVQEPHRQKLTGIYRRQEGDRVATPMPVRQGDHVLTPMPVRQEGDRVLTPMPVRQENGLQAKTKISVRQENGSQAKTKIPVRRVNVGGRIPTLRRPDAADPSTSRRTFRRRDEIATKFRRNQKKKNLAKSYKFLPSKTLSGTTAGLQSADRLKIEMRMLRQREDEAFAKIADEVSGRGAETVFRSSGRKAEEKKKKGAVGRNEEKAAGTGIEIQAMESGRQAGPRTRRTGQRSCS